MQVLELKRSSSSQLLVVELPCRSYTFQSKFMGEVIQNTGQEFWRPPSILEPLAETLEPSPLQYVTEACAECGSEFMIGARFCHTCGLRRPAPISAIAEAAHISHVWSSCARWIRARANSAADSWGRISFPDWLHYLHFHEIQSWVGLPTAALVAFIIGLGCVAGAIGVSLFYKASNLPEFQAIQMWRIEWLLAATASFVAGILLKTPPDSDRH
jgi:hypothetical protein